MARSRLTLVPGLLIALSACAGKTPPLTSAERWAAVTALSPGTQIRVAWFDPAGDNPNRRAEGTLVNTDTTTVALDTRHGALQVLRAYVQRVEARRQPTRRDSLANGALIGGLVGAGVLGFMAPGYANSSDRMPPSMPLVLIGGGIGIGTFIDAARSGPSYHTIYRWQPRR